METRSPEVTLEDAYEAISVAVSLGHTLPAIPGMSVWMTDLSYYDNYGDYTSITLPYCTSREDCVISLWNWIIDTWGTLHHEETSLDIDALYLLPTQEAVDTIFVAIGGEYAISETIIQSPEKSEPPVNGQ